MMLRMNWRRILTAGLFAVTAGALLSGGVRRRSRKRVKGPGTPSR